MSKYPNNKNKKSVFIKFFEIMGLIAYFLKADQKSRITEVHVMPTQWKELFEELKKQQEAFIQAAESLEESQRERPGICGSWSSKEVIAHIAGWDKEVMRQFRLFQEGLEEAIEYDIDKFNKRFVQEREQLNWEETLEELKEIHKQFNIELSEIPLSEILKNEEYIDWMEVQIQHYDHHLTQLVKWL